MEEAIGSEHLEEVKKGLFDIDPEEVLQDIRNEGLAISSVEDMRDEKENYAVIEALMDRYTNRYARISAVGGARSGIGGITTSVTLGTLEMISTAIQLYRLSQRFAVLNGFDPAHPLHQDKVQGIYLNTLGFKAAAQAAIKFVLFRVYDSDDDQPASQNLFSRVVMRIARKVGNEISSNKAAKLMPLVGGAVGAYTSYTYACDTGNSMRNAFKEHYYKEWHNAEPPKSNTT